MVSVGIVSCYAGAVNCVNASLGWIWSLAR